ncbi:AAA family ATPase [Chryseolinea lacunae]|uniref:AAA family ATPase n=1 Tax=Chryseolinea lacunae TaxID=2801331 RepID=A0ABS1KNC8_9BACT|nr:AAA family ATPase [Chryseolinea lacunae]MBL0740988.1 AAA family ATPase [Chryseolinea lacunae]
MVIGLLVRNFKTYSGINYIPLTQGQNFCGLVGNNGIGKSSVLEALDCFFNNKQWSHNVITKKSGIQKTRPHVVPIFLIKTEEISAGNRELAIKLSEYIWELDENDINISQNKLHFKTFQEQLVALKRTFDKDNYLLLPLGQSYDGVSNLSIFNTKKLGELFITNFDKALLQMADTELSIFDPLVIELKEKFEYIYIPKDIDPESFTQLETKEIQSLMGETLIDIVEKCVPQNKIQEINGSLNQFIESLSSILEEYSFRTVGERQVNLRKHDVYKLIIEAYFKIRKLHKKEGDHWLEMASLSSGEKQKAIIEIAYQFLKNQKKNTDRIILAIDEPESSLHMSACYDQFNKLFEISLLCRQLIFTTHWYGFIPTVEDGCVSVISKRGGEHVFDSVGIGSYREAIKQSNRTSQGKLPYDIRLKSINDFVQSVITSILTDEPYNWLICEGTSEKIYFEKYLKDIKKDKKLRIIPVGGASEIKRIYNNLQVAYEDFRKEIKGKVILISDTDTEIVQYATRDELKNLICFRMVNTEKNRRTELVRMDSTLVSPKTEIEDALNGKLFYQTLLDFQNDHPDIQNVLSDVNDPLEEAAYFALDLSPSKRKILENFFDSGNIKFEFANRYASRISDEFSVPGWIDDIKKLY